MNRIEIERTAVQVEAISNVFKQDVIQPTYVPHPVLDQLKSYDRDFLRGMFGDVGQKLIAFGDAIDFTHPDVSSIISQDGCELLSQILKVGEFTFKNNLNVILPQIRILANQEINSNLQLIDDPARNCRLARMIKSPSLRQEVRKSRKFRKITLEAFHRENNGNWDQLPDSCKLMLRFGKGEEEIIKAERMRDRYKKLGYTSLQEEIDKSIALYKTKTETDYLGFKRIHLAELAVVLAKIHGCSYLTSPGDIFSIKYPIDEFPFKTDVQREPSPLKFTNFGYIDHVGSLSEKKKDYDYTPRAYTYEDLYKVASIGIKKVVDHLEALPEIGNRPAFDCYMVVVPTIDYPSGLSFEYQYTDKNGVVNNHSHFDEAQAAFDLDLIRSKKILPVLVAERDDKCYFISYFQ